MYGKHSLFTESSFNLQATLEPVRRLRGLRFVEHVALAFPFPSQEDLGSKIAKPEELRMTIGNMWSICDIMPQVL